MYVHVFIQEDPGLRESSYELCYNHSCYLIGQGDMSGAQEKLRKAEGRFLNHCTILNGYSHTDRYNKVGIVQYLV